MSRSSIGFSIFLDGKLVDEVRLERPVINVGKLSTSTLRLDDVNVSRKHAVIEQREDGGWRVTDLGSTNGTLLRGQRVAQAALRDGDRLVLGNTTLVVHIDPVAGARRPMAPMVVVSGATSNASAEEIRGLGEASFYQKQAPGEGTRWVLDVALLWGETVLAAKTFHKPNDVVFGEMEPADFLVPEEAIGGASWALASVRDGAWALDLRNPNVAGDVLVGDKVRSLAELADEGSTLPISGALRARLRFGDFTVLVAHSPMIAGDALRRDIDKDPFLALAVSAVVQLALLGIAQTTPEDLTMSTRDPRALRHKVVQALKVTSVEPEPDERADEEPERAHTRRQDESPALDAKEVVAPHDATPIEPGRHPLVDKLRRPTPAEDLAHLTPAERHQRARVRAQETALARAFRADNPLFDKLMTDPDLAAAPSPFKALGLDDPSAAGDFADSGNINPFSGFDVHGGDFLPSEGGPPDADPDGGRPIADLPRERTLELTPVPFHEHDGIVVAPKPPHVPGGELDPLTVQQHIRRQLSGLRWCYQDRLQANHRLEGKLTLAFAIFPDGSTHGARTIDSTLGDALLERCIATKMARWRFPQPNNGGVVDVTYPLILKSHNSARAP